METLWQDVRCGLRLLAIRPGFAAIAILTLALGIGANITIFGLMNVLSLKSLPVWHPEELVQVTGGETNAFSNPIWDEFRDHQDIFSGAFAWGSPRFNLADGGQVRYANGLWVSGEFFPRSVFSPFSDVRSPRAMISPVPRQPLC
jgi:putative ABC transport system permease protein